MSIHDSLIQSNLLQAMETLKNNKSYCKEFIKQLMSINLYFVVYIEDDIDALLKNDISFNILKYKYLGSTDEKGKCMVAFTNEEEVGDFQYKNMYKIIELSFTEYVELLLTKYNKYEGIVINPYHQDLVVYKKDILEFMKEYLEINDSIEENQDIDEYGINNGINDERDEEKEEVLIGLPSNCPKIMIDKLTRYFNRSKLVKKAYLLWMIRRVEDGVEGSYLLVVDSKELPDTLFPKLGAICLPYLKGKFIDITLYKESFGRRAVEGYDPFYKYTES